MDEEEMNRPLKQMYERLARFLADRLNIEAGSVILEAGCGSGQLTIPFAKKILETTKEFRILALDSHSGPYRGDLEVLRTAIVEEGLDELVTPLTEDVRRMNEVQTESIDVIVSNELFCDLDHMGLEKTLREFYRVLNPRGQMAHGNLSPVAETPAQKLLIEGDSHSLETSTPKPGWFSPPTDEVVALLHGLNFRNITAVYFETNVRFGFDEAVDQLRKWTVDPRFIEDHIDELRRYGVEFPIEPFIFCTR